MHSNTQINSTRSSPRVFASSRSTSEARPWSSNPTWSITFLAMQSIPTHCWFSPQPNRSAAWALSPWWSPKDQDISATHNWCFHRVGYEQSSSRRKDPIRRPQSRRTDSHSTTRQLYGHEGPLAPSDGAGSGFPGFHAEDQDPSLVWRHAQHEEHVRRSSGRRYGWPKNILHWKGIQESILDICATVPVHFVIADGIIAMEGNGPLNGTARPLGKIVLADDPVAADATCARLMGFEPSRIVHLREGAKFLGNTSPPLIDHAGESIIAPVPPLPNRSGVSPPLYGMMLGNNILSN